MSTVGPAIDEVLVSTQGTLVQDFRAGFMATKTDFSGEYAD